MDNGFETRPDVGEHPVDSEFIAIVLASGLFDLPWYCASYRAEPATAVLNWMTYGWREGQRPNFYFDTDWYLTYYPDVAASGINPLLHYIHHGEQEGRRPSIYFDPSWYRETFHLEEGALCLAHYLRER
jgi:hypothetical protein